MCFRKTFPVQCSTVTKEERIKLITLDRLDQIEEPVHISVGKYNKMSFLTLCLTEATMYNYTFA